MLAGSRPKTINTPAVCSMSKKTNLSGKKEPSPSCRLHRRRPDSHRTGWPVGIIVVAVLGMAVVASRHSDDRATAAFVTLPPAASPTLFLSIVDDRSGQPTAARFSLIVDEKPYYPESLGEHGLRFVSIHESKKQVYVVTYSRGSGTVEIPLPSNAKEIEVHAAKGFEYFPAAMKQKISGSKVNANLRLRRWTDQLSRGWAAADERSISVEADREQARKRDATALW